MTSNNKLVHYKQQRIQSLVKNSDSYRFFNLLTGPDLLLKVEALLPESHRERQFPPTETLSMFLAQAMSEDRSCQKAVNTAAIKRVVGGLSLCSTATGGYCQARGRLPLSMVSTLARYTGEQMNRQVPEPWRWQGKRVLLIDGTTVTLPDTVANQAVYPQQSGQKPGLGFPISRIVGVIGLSSGARLNASLGCCRGKGTSEQRLLRPMLNTFRAGDLVLGDAYFGTYFLLVSLLDSGYAIKHLLLIFTFLSLASKAIACSCGYITTFDEAVKANPILIHARVKEIRRTGPEPYQIEYAKLEVLNTY